MIKVKETFDLHDFISIPTNEKFDFIRTEILNSGLKMCTGGRCDPLKSPPDYLLSMSPSGFCAKFGQRE